jgi:hypothetical protein
MASRAEDLENIRGGFRVQEAKIGAGAHKYASDSPWRVAQYDQSLAKAAGDMMDTAFKLPPGPEREATLAHLTTQYGKHLPEHMVAPLTAASGFREVPEKPGEGAYQKSLADAVKVRTGQEAERGFKLHRADIGKDFDSAWNAQHGTPTGATGFGRATYAPITDPGILQDRERAREIAIAHDPEAGMKHFQERQEARKWLQTQALPDNFDANAYLSAVSSDPRAWAELMEKASGVRPGPAAGTQPAASTDPAYNRLSGFVGNFGKGAVQAAEMFNRGVRQVVPGSSTLIDERGRVSPPSFRESEKQSPWRVGP